MAQSKHKAATEVVLAAHEEKSAFQLWVERNWRLGAIVAAAITAGILVSQLMSQQQQAAAEAEWDTLGAAMFPSLEGGEFPEGATMLDGFSGLFAPELSAIEAALADVQGTPAEIWGLLGKVQSHIQAREFGEAQNALGILNRKGDALPKALQVQVEVDGTGRPILDALSMKLTNAASWRANNPQLFANPAPPADAQRVRISTSAGDIVVALYEADAPEHCQNFLKRVEDGSYVDTKFFKVSKGERIVGGDPNTKEGNFETWGQGGSDNPLEDEDNELYHFEGVLSMESAQGPLGAGKSSEAVFFITTGDAHRYDRQNVVFGAVVEGLDVAKSISELEHEDPATQRPVDPVVITGTTKL